MVLVLSWPPGGEAAWGGMWGRPGLTRGSGPCGRPGGADERAHASPGRVLHRAGGQHGTHPSWSWAVLIGDNKFSSRQVSTKSLMMDVGKMPGLVSVSEGVTSWDIVVSCGVPCREGAPIYSSIRAFMDPISLHPPPGAGW